MTNRKEKREIRTMEGEQEEERRTMFSMEEEEQEEEVRRNMLSSSIMAAVMNSHTNRNLQVGFLFNDGIHQDVFENFKYKQLD